MIFVNEKEIIEMNRICEVLGIKYPIIQGPMTWITNAEMVAAISNAGGLGVLASNAGQTVANDDPKVVRERMCEEIRKTKALTDKPFGINYLLPVGSMSGDDTPDVYSEALLDAAVKEGVKVIIATGDYNEKILRRFKDLGMTVVFREGNPNIEHAKRAEEAGVVDIIVATGCDEGGGMPGGEVGTISIVPIFADAINLPLMAAGGIVDKRGVKAALALGAEGVFCGTVFIASEECPAHINAKQDIIDTESSELITYRAVPAYWRTTPNKLTKELKEKSEQGLSLMDMFMAMGGTGSLKKTQLDGDMEGGINSVNSAISLIKEIRPCKKIIEDMMDGIEF